MVEPPYVVLERLTVGEDRATPKRKKVIRRRRNKRAYFTQVKTHPNGPGTSYFRGWESDEECRGFNESEVTMAFFKSEESRQKYEEQCEVREPFRCISVALDSNPAPVYMFKVVPLVKRPIRVLSLFDGIATALHILQDVLHVKVEVYYSSEIDADALQLQAHKYSGQIVQLGDARKLDPGKRGDNLTLLNALGRIDLLVGGPPCQDTSRVNHKRKRLSMQREGKHQTQDT